MYENETLEHSKHLGHKISSIRRLVGLSQSALGEKLGITKQAVSKLEQSEKIDDKRIGEIAGILGVTEEGLKKFKDESVIYNTINFYENCGVKAESVIANVENLHQTPVEKLAKVFEELIKMDKEKFEKATSDKKSGTKK
jgi:transcriptional regulator with XRE-family HTH domain